MTIWIYCSSNYHIQTLFFTICVCIYILAGIPGAAQEYFTILLWNSPMQIDLRDQVEKIKQAGSWVGQGYQPIIEARWNEKHLLNFGKITQKQGPTFGGVEPVGPGSRWASKKYEFTMQTHLGRNFCLLDFSRF